MTSLIRANWTPNFGEVITVVENCINRNLNHAFLFDSYTTYLALFCCNEHCARSISRHAAYAYLYSLYKVITIMGIGPLDDRTFVLDLGSVIWGVGERCTIVHCITSQPANAS